MSESATNTVDYINYVFTALFMLEAALKLTAFGCRYFKDNWNRFDFIIVSLSILFTILDKGSGLGVGSAATVLRTIRIGRMIKFVRKMQTMKIIFATFLNTLNALLNVGSLLFLIIYIYAVIGINLFADIKMKSPMHERLNF
jgi:hypothetical protein